MEHALKILLVEDEDTDEELLIRFLKKENIDFTHKRVWLKEDYLKALQAFHPDLIISDHSLPLFSGMEAFYLLKKNKKIIPFILITGTVSEKILTEYMKEGLDDYILKENLLRLPSAIENVLNKKRIEKLHHKLIITNNKLETAYADIKDSIHYASRIQRSILPSKEELSEVCKNHFVFYRPKDVVSGDFYWCAQTLRSNSGSPISLIAVVDCTGHGVPGAFMSMMANTLLNQTIKNPEVNSPADVLDFLDRELHKNLKYHEGEISVRDGMDIAFCTIDYVRMELEFAGANNSCIIARNHKLIELPADKQAISACTDIVKKPFTNRRFQLQKGDLIYLFTDGYADQFGGMKQKKFMFKNFKKMLLDLQKKKLPEQQESIEQIFDSWKGKLEQIDDVLVMGIAI